MTKQVIVSSPPQVEATLPVARLSPPTHVAVAAAHGWGSKVVPQSRVLLAGRTADAAAELQLQLEYTAGMFLIYVT